MVKAAPRDDHLPSTVTAFGGTGCTALAFSNDGLTIAVATEENIKIFPVRSIWVPSVILNLPDKSYEVNMELQAKFCAQPNCLYKKPYPECPKETPELFVGRKFRNRPVSLGTIQSLQFFGETSRYLVGIGPFHILIYDLRRMALDPLISIDTRYFGVNCTEPPYELKASFCVLNIHRMCRYIDERVSCIDFLFSTRPYVPTYYRVFFSEDQQWWAVDCSATAGLIQREALDEDVEYTVYNHIGQYWGKPKEQRTEAKQESKGHEAANGAEKPEQTDGTTANTEQCPTNGLSEPNTASMPGMLNVFKGEVGKLNGMTIAHCNKTAVHEVYSRGDCDDPPTDNVEDADAKPAKRPAVCVVSPKTKPAKPKHPNQYHPSKQDNKGVYHALCLLRKKVYYTPADISKFALNLPDSTLSYKQEFIVATFVPVASVVVINFSVENTFRVKCGRVSLAQLGATGSQILADLVVPNLTLKISSLDAAPGGKVFAVVMLDRFCVLRYTSPAKVDERVDMCGMCTNEPAGFDSPMTSANTNHLNGFDDDSIAHDSPQTIPSYRIHNSDDGAECTIAVQFCHYDPVSKLRYIASEFNHATDKQYLAMSIHYNSQWGMQMFDMDCNSGVDSMILALDASRCRGFALIRWSPIAQKILVLSRFNGELYMLEPKPKRSWMGLIPNFTCIEKNIEFIESEDIFDRDPSAKAKTEAKDPEPPRPPVGLLPTRRPCTKYPFYHVGFSIFGQYFLRLNDRPVIAANDAVYHDASEDSRRLFNAFIGAPDPS